MKTKVFIFSGSLPWICTYIRLNYQIKIEIIKTNESFKFMSYDCRNQFSLKPLHLYGELQFEVRNDFELSCFINCVLRYFFFLWDTFLTVELLFVRDLISGLCFDSIFLCLFWFLSFCLFFAGICDLEVFFYNLYTCNNLDDWLKLVLHHLMVQSMMD